MGSEFVEAPETVSVSDTLYHYTSVGSFLSICENRSLRASDLKALNDPREISLGSELLDNYISELGYPKAGPPQSHLAALREQYNELKNTVSLFGISLSRTRDSLPQWLEYGDRGRGICIGLRQFPFDPKLHGFIQASEVSYSQSGFLERIQEVFVGSEDEWVKSASSLSEEDKEQHAFVSALRLLSTCAAYKHHTWEHEQEVRYTIISYRFGSNRSTQYTLPEAISGVLSGAWPKFRERSGHIIPYVDLPLGDNFEKNVGEKEVDTLFVLDEAIIGPICPADIDIVGAALNREVKGLYCPKISKSDCNIRP